MSESPPPYQAEALTRTASNGASAIANRIVADPMWGNPFVQIAVQTLDQLSDIGAALPFVAPAFIIVKFIIDTEKRARDVDVKCNDLLERIVFMLSHLTVLRRVKVVDATCRVIERMNDVLKTAASLIQAYRKQGFLARRLNTSNKDKFTSCAESINSCCADLMISLQIHQTGQLEVLTRSVPVDPQDRLVQNFVTDHGGVDNVTADYTLIAQLAHELHVKMDDEVMEQINTNITQLMQDGQVQLEKTLNENISAAVVDGIKGLAAQINEAEKEQTFKCVQCDQDYRNSTNGPTACSFHRGEYSSWTKSYPCCDTSHPCQFQSHRSVHHCDYPYGSFFQRSRNILNYVDTVDTWAQVEDTNLENNDIPKASIGQLLRWVSGGQRLEEPTILITVGAVWFSEPYFFDTFTAKQLEHAARVISITRRTTIFRTSQSESQFAMAEWVLSPEGAITAVRISAKASTSEMADVRLCPIDATTCTMSGEVLTISEGGLRSYTPASIYILPKIIRVSPELHDKPLRTTRTDFKTRTSSSLPVILKAVSEPPLKANLLAQTDCDVFDGVVSVFNKHPAGSTNPLTFAAVSASFRLVGDATYTPVKFLKVLDSQLPVTIDPRQSWMLHFQAAVPRTDEDAKLGVKWWNRAFIARHRPLRLKLKLQDIEEEEATLVLEYVYSPYPLEKPNESDIGFFHFDDPALWERRSIRITKADGCVVRIGSTDIDAIRLRRAVYHSLKTGETEVDLGIGQEKEYGVWEWKAWALVDISCQRVYAFKVLLKQGPKAVKMMYGCLGYVICPSYDKTDASRETRVISYAAESVALPELEPFTAERITVDDDVDDAVVAQESTRTAAPASTPNSQMVAVPDELLRRLASIDTSLSRIATAVEGLVDVLSRSNGIPG